MNFLSEVISSAEKVEVENINKAVPKIVSEIKKLKCEVNNFLENVYDRYIQRPRTSTRLLNTAQQVTQDLNVLIVSVESVGKKDIQNAADGLAELTLELKKSDFELKIVSQLIHIHEGLVSAREYQDKKQFTDAANTLIELSNLVKYTPEDEATAVINELKENVMAEQKTLFNNFTIIFRENLVLETADKKQRNRIKVRKFNEEMEQIFAVVHYFPFYVSLLEDLNKFVWNFILVPIVNNSTSLVITEDDNFNILEISIKSCMKDKYDGVFSKIISVMHFLRTNFNYFLKDVHVLAYIGSNLRDDLSELLINNCLIDTVPSTEEELKTYEEVIESTKKLYRELTEFEIFAEDSTSILDYVNDIDILFINKKCQEYTDKAISIMKKDLHDTVEVGVPYDGNDPLSEFKPNEFPQCLVSRSTVELLNLAEAILEQMSRKSDEYVGYLLCTNRNIFKSYCNVIREHHQKLLQTIPQQVAIFYNNCMYISHRLQFWNETHKDKLTDLLNSELAIFVDEPHELQTVGSETFAVYVKEQIQQIDTIIEESALSTLQAAEKLDVNVEKHVRQCLRQQELLKTVWSKVLSYYVYNETIGNILNSFCNSLIKKVLRVEDISADTAEVLVDIYRIVTTRGPKLFTDPKEICLYVKSWYKLNELVFVLSAGLVDISDRWSDGKGPLAIQFKPSELKGLIRALFQNTDRRAAVLAKIID